MKIIKLTPKERRRGIETLLGFHLVIPATLFLLCVMDNHIIHFAIWASFPFCYFFFRSVILLWREHWLMDVFKVDTQYIEKVSPTGFSRRAAWQDLINASDISLFVPTNLHSLLRRIILGQKPIQLVFSDRTKISVPTLLRFLHDDTLFLEIFSGIAKNGPPENLLLTKLEDYTSRKLEVKKAMIEARKRNIIAKETAKKNSLVRWCLISQVFPIGFIIFAHIAYFGLGAPWHDYIGFNCVGLIASPFFLVVVFIYTNISRRLDNYQARSSKSSE